MIAKPKAIPSRPGVYLFWKKKTPLYIGKAANLRQRVGSYFQKNPPWKTEELIKEATRLQFLRMESEIEALIREAELIKRHRPKYNVLMRDDKNYLYVSVSRDPFPRFYFTRQPERGQTAIGPFTEAADIKYAMQLLRRIFPYCTCRRPHRGGCVNAEIGRCPGYCCKKGLPASEAERREYLANISRVAGFLEGKRNKIASRLKKEIKAAAKDEKYEHAARLRDQMGALLSMYRHRGIAQKRRMEVAYSKIERVLQDIFQTRDPIRRIEGYDIANISGADAAGSMVVFYDGRPDKSQYRKFKIKTVRGANDTASHREVIARRLKREEWELPDLILIDGGKGQLNSVRPLFNRKAYNRIKISALAKPPRKLFSRAPSGAGQNADLLHVAGRQNPIALASLPPPVMFLLQRVRDESHRFARAYHHHLRRKSLILPADKKAE